MLRRFVNSIGLWYLYFPHMALLRFMGPRCAILVTRGTSFVHWLVTFAAARGRVRRGMEQVIPKIRPDLSVNSVLRKYVVIKQQHFVQWQLSPTVRGRRFAQQICDQLEGRQHLDAAIKNGRGVIIAFFHFGMARTNIAALELNGYDAHIHEVPDVRYAGRCYGFVARAVVKRENEVKEAIIRKRLFHSPMGTFKASVDLLRRNSIVVLMADGMVASRFVEVPFLKGTTPFSTGLARLAAETGAPIICLFSLLEGLTRHRFVIHPPVYCSDDSPASIEATVRTYAGIFEGYVRQYPWAWWSWRRVEVEQGADGKIRFILMDVPTKETDSTPQKKPVGDGMQ